MRIVVAVATLIFWISASAATPCFDDYSVDVYSGAIVKPERKSENDSIFEIIKEATEFGVNFAGKYIVVHYACGGGCVTGGVYDAAAGKLVADFPDEFVAGDEPETFHSNFRKDSRLILIEGVSAYDGQFVRGYYEIVNGELKPIKD